MASLTIRKLDEAIKTELRLRAARNRSSSRMASSSFRMVRLAMGNIRLI